MNPEPLLQAAGFIPSGQFVVALLSMALVISCVLLHYEVLRLLSAWLDRMRQLRSC